MAILGKIRERSIFLIFIIGMALLAFVFTGVFDGNSRKVKILSSLLVMKKLALMNLAVK
jgi:hypothetical protein